MISLKRVFFTLAIAALIALSTEFASAQLRIPRESQKASVSQTIGVTDVTISYHRPGVKGRTIWGDPLPEAAAKGEATLDDGRSRPAGAPIVPYGHVWRTGANDATQFVVTDDVLINGQPLPAGSYSLHTIPGKTEWTIVFNGTANQWGSFNYDPKKDLLRVKAVPRASPHSQEWLMFAIDPVTENSATVNIMWEKVWVPFTVEVKDVVATTIKNARSMVDAAKADDFRTPFSAAQYAIQNKQSEVANGWLAKALKAVDEAIKVKETFGNLSAKTNILLASGRKDEALVVADAAIVKGKAEKADTAAFEKRIADIKAGKQ